MMLLAQTHEVRNADAVVEQSGDSLCFVEPYEVSEPFTAFLDYVQQDSNTAPKSYQSRNVKYAQTRKFVPYINFPLDND